MHKVKNALGTDTEYLRTSLMPSLILAAKDNIGMYDNFHLFEMSNIYLPKTNSLPEERLMLAGIFYRYKYRNAKGIVEALLQKINVTTQFKVEDSKDFSARKALTFKNGKEEIGIIGITDNNFVYYEFSVEKLIKLAKHLTYKEISKYPAQFEDITFYLPEKINILDVAQSIILTREHIIEVAHVGDPFNRNYTFTIKYHNPEKTLTNDEVEKMRNEIIQKVKTKFGGRIELNCPSAPSVLLLKTNNFTFSVFLNETITSSVFASSPGTRSISAICPILCSHI